MLRLCADLANGSKHLSLTSSRTGDKSTDIARNDVTVFVGTATAAHSFYVQSGNKEYDVRDIAEAPSWSGPSSSPSKGRLLSNAPRHPSPRGPSSWRTRASDRARLTPRPGSGRSAGCLTATVTATTATTSALPQP